MNKDTSLELEIVELQPELQSKINAIAPELNTRIRDMALFCKKQQDDIADLRGLVMGLRDQLDRHAWDMPLRIESPEQDKLRIALGQASLECLPLNKTSSAQGGKLAFSLQDVQAASKEALRVNQIAINFEERKNLEGKHVLITIVTHLPSEQYKVYTTDVGLTNNPDRNHAIKGGYSLAMKRMLQQLLNLGDE